MIAIATHSDCFKNIMPAFQLLRSKTKLDKSRNFDWLMVLFAPVVIGRSYTLALVFQQ